VLEQIATAAAGGVRNSDRAMFKTEPPFKLIDLRDEHFSELEFVALEGRVRSHYFTLPLFRNEPPTHWTIRFKIEAGVPARSVCSQSIDDRVSLGRRVIKVNSPHTERGRLSLRDQGALAAPGPRGWMYGAGGCCHPIAAVGLY